MQSTTFEQEALECRKLASEMNDPAQKKQIEDMAELLEMLARKQSQQTDHSRSVGFLD
jgi:RNA polymerase-interacting CarD/CdnL/TRCF family regulator